MLAPVNVGERKSSRGTIGARTRFSTITKATIRATPRARNATTR